VVTLDDLMDFAKWITQEADIETNDACACHPEYYRDPEKIEAETARWWRERGYGNTTESN
jgi:hypothetical protein